MFIHYLWDLNGFFLAERGEDVLFIGWTVSIASIAAIIMYPQGDLNPCLQAENLTSWATRRWGHKNARKLQRLVRYYR